MSPAAAALPGLENLFFLAIASCSSALSSASRRELFAAVVVVVDLLRVSPKVSRAAARLFPDEL